MAVERADRERSIAVMTAQGATPEEIARAFGDVVEIPADGVERDVTLPGKARRRTQA